jgi:hypothetical protein
MPDAPDYRQLTALPFALATVLQGALEAEGVTATLEREGLSSIYGLDSGVFATRVLVPVEELARARELLDDLQNEDAE